MASDIRLSTEFLDHPKVVKLMRRLELKGLFALLRFWMWVAENRPDGDLAHMDAEDIEIAAKWDGESGALVAAMRAVRLLDGDEGSYAVHDWQEHQPWVAKRDDRREQARNAAVARWGAPGIARGKQPTPTSNADRMLAAMLSACDEHAGSTQSAMPPTQPNPTHTQTNEKPKPPARASLALPDWLPAEQWGGFIEMRKRIKAPLTDRAVTLAIGELEKLRANGQDVGAVLDQSVANGWKGLFPLKANGHSRAAPGLHGPFHQTDYTAGTKGQNPDGSYRF